MEKPHFTDYLRAGWQIGLTIAIDYTASNHMSNLHAIGPQNQYMNAIGSVGSIIEPYDHTKFFPVFGFGGIHQGMGHRAVSHCFPINANM